MSCQINLISTNKCTNAFLGCDYQLGLVYESVNLTGSTFAMQIQAVGADVNLLTLAMSAVNTTGFYLTDAETGAFTMTILSADVDALGAGNYDYIIKMTDTAGIEKLFMYGQFEVVKAI